ncbi:small integral membrane protein 4 [Trichogramma pretiosum]|uniref:small integral membrane protein 4 n=1 Tax=Trichogramma pretiosum TaxID=7493 RepID=UPI0006C9D147|nr:small integral membrane protein 4 [Trichogramma pretiosum]
MFYSRAFARLLRAWPGRQTFGPYRFLPVFFVAGAALEYLMIHWHAGEVNFYKTYKKRRVEEICQEREKLSVFQEHDIQIRVNKPILSQLHQ